MTIKNHPKYKNYEFNSNGKFRKLGATEWSTGRLNNHGKYFLFRSTTVQRAIWEAFKGPIPDGMEVDHKNNDNLDNRLSNLQLLTKSENTKKKDNGFLKAISKTAHMNRKHILATNMETGEEKVFRSKNQAAKYYGLSSGGVYQRCVGQLYSFDNRILFSYTEKPVDQVFTHGSIGQKRASRKKVIINSEN